MRARVEIATLAAARPTDLTQDKRPHFGAPGIDSVASRCGVGTDSSEPEPGRVLFTRSDESLTIMRRMLATFMALRDGAGSWSPAANTPHISVTSLAGARNRDGLGAPEGVSEDSNLSLDARFLTTHGHGDAASASLPASDAGGQP